MGQSSWRRRSKGICRGSEEPPQVNKREVKHQQSLAARSSAGFSTLLWSNDSSHQVLAWIAIWYCSLCCATKRSLVQVRGQTLSKSPMQPLGKLKIPQDWHPFLPVHLLPSCCTEFWHLWRHMVSGCHFDLGALAGGTSCHRIKFPLSSVLSNWVISIEKVQQLLPKHFLGHMFG